MNRCAWVNLNNPLYIAYHDHEWGRPVHDDRAYFELLILEGFQAGLSWEIVLNKREAFRAAFAHFEPQIVARFTEQAIEERALNPAIIRNRRKLRAAVQNAQVFLDILASHGSFRTYLDTFTLGKITVEPYTIRTTSPLSEALAKDLHARGMRFVGPTIMYSFLQAVGVLDPHGPECDLAV